MNTLSLSTVLLTVVAFATSQTSPATPLVDVAIYYEALCPDSIAFFRHQFYPNYKELREYINVELIPFGKAEHSLLADGTWLSKCRHTQIECEGHKIQACAIKLETNENVLIDYISCLMNKGDKTKPYPGSECVNDTDIGEFQRIDYKAVEDCANSIEADKKLEEFQTKTKALKPPLANVPTVVFNSVFDKDAQEWALKDFVGAFCSQIPTDLKPNVCTTHQSEHSHTAYGGHKNVASMSAAGLLVVVVTVISVIYSS